MAREWIVLVFIGSLLLIALGGKALGLSVWAIIAVAFAWLVISFAIERVMRERKVGDA